MQAVRVVRSTTCRICESACGLLATVDDGRITALEPDPAHPVSKGFACRKGTTFHRRLAGAHRLRVPTVQGEPVGWSTALETAGEALSRVRQRFGPGAVGLYSGNAAGHGFGAVLGLEAFQRAFEGCRHYSCLTLDNSEMFAVAEAVWGHPLTHFVADYAGSDAIVLFGTDPLSSQPSQAQSHPDGVRQLRSQREVLVVVDPRRSATAAVGTHLPIRVGGDLVLLAWLVRRALDRGRRVAGADRIRAALDTVSLGIEQVGAATGLSARAVRDLDDRLARAERPLVWSGLGVLLGRDGTLGWWLTGLLQALVGGIGPGRPWAPGGSARLQALLKRIPLIGRDETRRSRIGDWPAMLGTIPAATLPGDITTPDDDGGPALKALVSIGGEPGRALPDSRAADRALSKLESLVCIGVFAGPTARRADVVLPVASWLERRESALHNAWQRPVPAFRSDPAVVHTPLPTDWEVLTELCRAADRPVFGSRVADRALGWAQSMGWTPETLAEAVGPWVLGGGAASTTPAPRWAVPTYLDALPDALRAAMESESALRLLTTVRPSGAMNHWIRPRREPVARAHPEDLAAAGLIAGSTPVDAVLKGPAGRLAVTLSPDPELSRGTVVVPFGGAVNPNQLVAADALEPFSGQPFSNGTRVTILPPSVDDPGINTDA